ncbi:unnamed protein product [Lactuca virosa]|uniref:Uncharacterized protein n=1 Tax=Lactuca virosa TaxID=75947 RepID=A0AAU9M6S7_9ASTR|nr:unnamed protein product [Lactuca virosa]
MAENPDPIVDVHYKGTLTPSPLMYFDGNKASVPYTVVNKMTFPDFIPFLEKHTKKRCRYVYYCPHEVRLSEGLHLTQNDYDFNEFLEDINEKKRLDVYVDHYHEPLFDWIKEEEADLEDDDLVSIYDVDSILEYGPKVEHVKDDEVISLKRNFNDHFLNKLCPVHNDDLVEEDHNATRPIYPRHDHTQEWNEMKPRLGTTKVNVPYKVGDKLVDVMLEVSNLDKKETLSINTISNQELSERMEAEMLRLNHLPDRTSEKRQKKGYPKVG